jgi:predicted amidohydrolase
VRIALFQFGPVFGDKPANFARVSRAFDGIVADIIVLPELFSTGYCFRSRNDVALQAEDLRDGPTSVFLKDAARKTNAAIVAGVAESCGPAFFNSCLTVLPDGNSFTYRKIHLFDKEKDHFDAGAVAPRTWQFRGARIGTMVCFDYFFPELARMLALSGAQIICHPANLVLHYAQQVTVTRALENRVFWALCNRVGTEQGYGRKLTFTGQSQLVNPTGEVLFRASPEEAILRIIEIDPTDADNKTVGSNDLFRDRRPDIYRS